MKTYIIIALLLINQITYADHGLEGLMGGSYSFNFTNSSLVLSKNRWLIQYYSDYRFFKPYSSHQIDEIKQQTGDVVSLRSTWGHALRFNYGLSNRITLSGQIPFARIYANRLTPSSTDIETTSLNNLQMGDASVMANFLIYNNKKSLWQTSFMTGIELPTGYTSKETNIISGSGSFDPIVGLSVSKRWKWVKLNGNTVYKLTTKNHDGQDYGDYLYYQVVASYSLTKNKKSKHESGTEAFSQDSCACSPGVHWLLNVGFTGEALAKQKNQGDVFANTGFHRNYASLGVIAAVNNWSFSLGTEWTITEKLNGIQNHLNGRVQASIALYL